MTYRRTFLPAACLI